MAGSGAGSESRVPARFLAGSERQVPGQFPNHVPNHGFQEGSGAGSEPRVPGRLGQVPNDRL